MNETKIVMKNFKFLLIAALYSIFLLPVFAQNNPQANPVRHKKTFVGNAEIALPRGYYPVSVSGKLGVAVKTKVVVY